MLWKKMLRDLRENKGTYFACTVVIILGLMVFSAFSMVVENLYMSQQQFYQEQNFAHGFGQVKAIPPQEVSRLEAIEGIAEIQGRVIKDVRVLHPEGRENVYLRLVSIDTSLTNPINGVEQVFGIPLSNRELHVWIDNKFLEANRLEVNGELDIIADGRRRSLQIVDVGRSPEFIYALRTSADIFPTPEDFGIAFISLEVMKSLYPNERAFNDIVFTLQPGADFDQVKQALEYRLQPFGLKSLIHRDDQVSHLMLAEELRGLETMSKAFPLVFLSIAAIILYIMLKRMIEQQRGQVGILKAFGYTHWEIISHYLSYALTIGFFGGAVGGILGALVSYPFTSFYQVFYNMPNLTGTFSPRYIILSIFLSVGFALLAGYQGSKKILDLEPAEAMRPSAPVVGGKVLLERIGFFWNMLTVQGMMAVRNLSRNKGRSLFILIGIAFCFAISAFTWSMNDMIQKMIFDQFEKVEVYDAKVILARPINEKAGALELERAAGVREVEALAEVPMTLKHQWHKKDVLVLGIPADSRLYNILDSGEQRVSPPKDGILLSERLAELLAAEIGTSIRAESLFLNTRNGDREITVVGIIPQYLGLNAYMELGSLQEFLNQPGLATSFMLSMEQGSIPLLQEKYLYSDIIVAIDEQGQRLDKMRELMATYGGVIYIYSLIGMIIGFAIIYSTTIITLSERSRELASMMVLGMTPAEVLSVVTFEQWFISLIAMGVGIPLSQIFLNGIAQAISNDMFTMPTIITLNAFISATLVTGLSILIAQRFAARRIKQLSLVEVLKARE